MTDHQENAFDLSPGIRSNEDHRAFSTPRRRAACARRTAATIECDGDFDV